MNTQQKKKPTIKTNKATKTIFVRRRKIEVLHGSHVAWQEQKIPFPMGKEVLSYAKYFHCSCHATWLPRKTSIVGKVSEGMNYNRLPYMDKN